MLKKIKSYLKPFDIFLAQGFKVGMLPFPGTLGSLMAYPLYWLIAGIEFNLLFVGIFALVATFIAGSAEKKLGTDHSSIVIDEIAGFLLALCLISPATLTEHILAFILFRLLDVFKPWPISWVEYHVKGGLGVVIDDILAGLFTGGIFYLISLI